MEKIANGIHKIVFNDGEKYTPHKFLFKKMSETLNELKDFPCVFKKSEISFTVTDRGCLIEIPLSKEENIYGFGLQLKAVNHKGSKKQIRVNSDPVANTGDSHAPVPFYLSNKGYGVFVNTLRNASFCCGNFKHRKLSQNIVEKKGISNNVEDLYSRSLVDDSAVIIEIPYAKGVEIIFFSGENMEEALSRYNLFSGGGCIPPLWGMGPLYRAYGRADSKHVISIAQKIREDEIPCSVIGLEPGWQTRAYSCSFVIDEERFPDFYPMVDKLKKDNFEINLWEHAFTHPTSPLYKELEKYSGDYAVWDGLVPDFTIKKAVEIFSAYHKEHFTGKGILGFKLDECDDSDYSTHWSFPHFAQFPSGIDGEQMHAIFGVLYQKIFDKIMREQNIRYFNQVRSSYSHAASLCYALYSDLYSHKDFVRGIVNAGFSGLLWTPEVRQCDSEEEFIRRVEATALSPQACINAWMIPNPPWIEVDYDKNHNGVVSPISEYMKRKVKEAFSLRMELLPYIYYHFFKYYKYGVPAFKGLQLCYPNDNNVSNIDDQYMIGDDIMVAPFIADSKCEFREVYIPEGNWYCYYKKEKYIGGQNISISRVNSRIPIFVKEGSIVPIAKVKQYITKDDIFHISLKVFGENFRPCYLFEDDGVSYNFENGDYNIIKIEIKNKLPIISKKGNSDIEKYVINMRELF